MTEASGYPFAEVPLSAVAIGRGFWGERLRIHREVTLPHAIRQLEETGRVANFARAGGREPGPFQGRYGFDDSDVHKVLEGICYALMACPDPKLAAEADRLVGIIGAAQEPDGYLFTRTTLTDPAQRWTDMNSHEMYTGGHFIEAAVAHHQATGRSAALDVARRLADHYLDTFGPDKRHWVDGHEEIGIALMRLYEATGERRYAEFAVWHLEERGHGHGRGGIWDHPGFGPRYSQDRVPVRNLREAEGHAVRAMYLAAAMTDAVALMARHDYRPALFAVWDNLVNHKMYVTGGIGAAGEIEGFGPDDHLPNREAYCETCAAIALVQWSHRMNRLTGQARFADVLERVLYNGLLAGWSLAGDAFFYDNPLQADGSVRRRPWFVCACCPSNVARFIPSLGRYLYLVRGTDLVVNQFVASDARVRMGDRIVTVRQTTAMPWRGRAVVRVEPEAPTHMTVWLRKPAWARSVEVGRNGHPVDGAVWRDGYVGVAGRFAPGDEISVAFPMPVERVHANPGVEADRDRVALMRGPLVYCLEGVDNPAVDLAADATAIHPDALLVSVPPGHVAGLEEAASVRVIPPGGRPELRAIPYSHWANRDPGPMAVWLREA